MLNVMLWVGIAATAVASTQDDLAAIVASAEKVDAMPALRELCQGIGPRLTGSGAAQAATTLVADQMRAIGLQSVHRESWMLPRAWRRGVAHAALVVPFSLPIPIAAYGWTGSTPWHAGPVPVVLLEADEVASHLDGLVRSQAANWKGKALLVSSNAADPIRAYAALLPLLKAATAAHAIAVLRHDTRPGNGIVHAEPVAVSLADGIETGLVPAVDLPAEHQRLIEDLLRAKRGVSVDIAVQNSFSSGPVSSDNVVGEIVGARKPKEIVLVAAHLDSWDLGVGATDDGFGVAAVLGAAQTLVRAELKPSRTIRFVLFTGEEQGLLGSRAYVRRHAQELDHIVAVFALDWGAGPIVLLPTAGHPELLPLLTRFNELTPSLKLDAPKDGWLFMTDAYAFTLAGLPGIAALQKSPAYSEQGHSAEDTLDKVSSTDLAQAVKVLSMVGFFVADAQDLPRVHFTATETQAALTRGGQKPTLEALGMWPSVAVFDRRFP